MLLMSPSSRTTHGDASPKRATGLDDIRVTLFCGGRGSSSIIRNLYEDTSIDLSLAINAYDDGLSTGDLREFIPGLLGISDFRKNLSCIMNVIDKPSGALQRLLEFRLPKDITNQQVDTLTAFTQGRAYTQDLIPALSSQFTALDYNKSTNIKNYLKAFFDYAARQKSDFKYADCALGNLIFAGAYLIHGHFNSMLHNMGHEFGARAKLVNLCEGKPRTLVALKEDGSILCREADIVGAQNSSPIRAFFFLDRPLTHADVDTFASLSVAEKQSELTHREQVPHASLEILATLKDTDIIIYGPGTQNSSLLPSYRVHGVADALQKSKAVIKAFIVNLQIDHDIPCADARQLIDQALACMGDPDNARRSITHIFYNRNSQTLENGIKFPPDMYGDDRMYKGAAIIEDNYENSTSPTVHDGEKISAHILELYKNMLS